MIRTAAIPLLLAGLLSGALLPIQAGINARLRMTLSSPLQAAFVSFLVGTVALAVIVFLAPTPFPRQVVSRTPWWAWTGGLLGVFYIATAVILSPRLGALALASLFITGQLVTALVLDHFGLLAFPQVSISPSRVLGLAFLVLGVFLVLPRRG